MLIPILLYGVGFIVAGIGSWTFWAHSNDALCMILYGLSFLCFLAANATRPITLPENEQQEELDA